MSILQAAILGFLQGVTEFLPISSSGHLVILPGILGWEEHGMTFDVMLHGATLVALLFVFWKDVAEIVLSFRRDGDGGKRKLGHLLIVGSIPILLVGFLFGAYIDYVRQPVVIAASLIVWGIALWLVDKRRSARGIKFARAEKLRWYHAVLIGAAQSIALVPGTSRSGITIMAALMAGLSRGQAVRFSFLLGIPAFFAATIAGGLDVIKYGFGATPPMALIVGALVACASGVLAIKFLMRFVVAHHLTAFMWYRVILGILILCLLKNF